MLRSFLAACLLALAWGTWGTPSLSQPPLPESQFPWVRVLARSPWPRDHRMAVLDVADFDLVPGPEPGVVRLRPKAGGGGSPAEIHEATAIFTPTGPMPVVTVPDISYIPASLCVYRNGLLQYAPGDYTLVGVEVRFVDGDPTPVAGDVIQLKYRTP